MHESLEIVKKHLFFSLECLLENNVVFLSDSDKEALSFLASLKNKSLVDIYLVSGFEENKALEVFENSFLKDYFSVENFFFVTKEYVATKSKVDRQRYLDCLSNDSFFIDHYFKQFFLSNYISNKNLVKEDVVLLGNDFLFDAFYTLRFSKVDFALLTSKLSMRGEVCSKVISGLNYFSLTIDGLSKVLSWRFSQQNFFELEKFVFEDLSKGLFGENFKVEFQKSLENKRI